MTTGTMEATTHTPTPWAVGDNVKQAIYSVEDGECIAFAHNADLPELGGISVQVAKANAAFIVRAVNSHEALVAALESLMAIC